MLTNQSFFIIGTCYIPPNSKSEYYTQFIECVQTSLGDLIGLNVDVKLCLVGDFNIPGYDWITSSSYSWASGFHNNVNFRDAAGVFSDWCELYRFVQLNKHRNVAGNVLDLVLTDFYDTSVQISSEYFVKCDEAHQPLLLSFHVADIKYCESNEIVYNYRKANFAEISRRLADIRVPQNFSDGQTFDNWVHSIELKFLDLINEFVPKLFIKPKSFPHWYSNELKAAIVNKKIAHKQYKQYKSEYYYTVFKRERALCKLLASRDEKAYLEATEESVRGNSKHFFKYINNLSVANSIPSTVHLDNQTAKDGQAIVDLFARKFSSVYKELDLSNTIPKVDIADSFCNITFSFEEVEDCLKNLSPGHSPGPDLVHPLLIINCRESIVHWLVEVLNWSLKLGVFPDCWKLSYLSPFFKG